MPDISLTQSSQPSSSPSPSSSPYSLKYFKFAYLSALVVIVLLLSLAQVLIQASLREEVQAREYAQIIGIQSLRLQAMELDVLNLADKTQNVYSNALTFRATESAWEQVHQQIISLALSSDEEAKIKAAQPYYQAIERAARSIIALEGQDGKLVASMTASEKAAFTKDFIAMFYSEPPDLRGLVYVTQSLNFEADTYVSQIQIIELVIFALSLLVLCLEWFLVIRPANRQLHQYLETALAAPA